MKLSDEIKQWVEQNIKSCKYVMIMAIPTEKFMDNIMLKVEALEKEIKKANNRITELQYYIECTTGFNEVEIVDGESNDISNT